MATHYPLQSKAFDWPLSALNLLNSIPFSAKLLVRQCPPLYSNIQLKNALQRFGNYFTAYLKAIYEQIIQACQLAEIHTTIEKLPQGYQTIVGEHGTGLSGRQKQRIAIARALLKQPKVLIFDEAVSNLDQQTAEHFAQTVNKVKGKVTILFITHQLPKGL